MKIVHLFEVVGRGSETQLQKDENKKYLILRFKDLWASKLGLRDLDAIEID